MGFTTINCYANTEIKDNNRSCVVKVTSQFGSILLTGDIEKDAELALLRTNRDALADDVLASEVLASNVLASDVLIAPHHGSKTSSTVDFIQAVNAKQVIVTVGYLNRFKHPKPEILEHYQAHDADIYRSDVAGAVLINFNAAQGIQTEQWRLTHRNYWQDVN